MKHLRLVLIAFSAAMLFAGCAGRSVTPVVPNVAAGGASSVARGAASSYKLLYSFKGTPDGASPLSGLAILNGTLYGTTLNGSSNYCASSCGSNECYLGCGTVYTIDASGGESVIYNFNGNFNNDGDGSWPFAGLVPLKGLLYGTTGGAGAHGFGTIFRVSTSGKEKVLHSFGGSDGQDPEASLIVVKGTLYGTTVYGGGSGCGGNGCGTVFSITRKGSEHVLYAFQGGNDGYRAFAPLTYLNGNFYGATLQGGGTGCGGDGCGAIFELTPSGSEKVIANFGSGASGAFPNGLTAVNGVLYGTTEGGGSKSSGTFFSVTPSGNLQFLYSFKDIPDGNLPAATLTYHKGLFYSTTVGGGTSGNGTVFSISKSGTETVLYSFQGGTDGAAPQAPVIAVKSNLYGTTYKGGGTGCGGYGCGTVFRVKI